MNMVNFNKTHGTLINDEVAEMAINLYAELKIIEDNYSTDAICGIVPQMIYVLEILDACLKINSDLTKMLISKEDKENSLLQQLKNEKCLKETRFEEFLQFEDQTNKEISN